MTEAADKRWKVNITYRYDDGPRETVTLIEEIAELADIIEHGPDWRALAEVRITYDGVEGATIEQLAAE